jgi:hypothetical protein
MANPNPSPETRFQPGNNANPGGKTPEMKRLEMEAATMALKLRHATLSAMTEKVAKITELPDASLDDILKLIDSDVLRLFKDSEDRAHGTPKATIEGTGDGGAIVFKTVYEGDK